MKQKLMYEKSSGCVYHWTPELENNPGFIPYEPKPKVIEQAIEPVVDPLDPAADVKSMAAAVLKRKMK